LRKTVRNLKENEAHATLWQFLHMGVNCPSKDRKEEEEVPYLSNMYEDPEEKGIEHRKIIIYELKDSSFRILCLDYMLLDMDSPVNSIKETLCRRRYLIRRVRS